ncbi:MAG: D-alanine--D-alanine ligase [Nitrospinae bacterium]|nr:D-alanine--D-alanine ligase [Nitrospinota bacterium]
MNNLENKTIGVLMGGLSPEKEVSIVTGNSVLEAIHRKGLTALPVHVDHNIGETLKSNPIDLAFLALHGTFGEDGCIQGLLEYFNIPYTGAGVMGSALAYDKLKSKEILKFHGIPTAAYEVFYKTQNASRSMSLPVVVKPTNQGSSIGVTIVKDDSQWDAALKTAFSYSDEVIVEKFIEGKLLAIGMNELTPMPIVHIRLKSGFYDYEAKYTKGRTEYFCPADITEDEAERCRQTAIKVVHKRCSALMDSFLATGFTLLRPSSVTYAHLPIILVAKTRLILCAPINNMGITLLATKVWYLIANNDISARVP